MKSLKKSIAIFLVIALTFACVSMSSIAQSLKGDIDGDGTIATKDTLFIKRYLAKLSTPSFDVDAADIYADGVVDAKDVYWLKRKVADPDLVVPVPGETVATTQSGATTATTTTTTTTKYTGEGVPDSYPKTLAFQLKLDDVTFCSVSVNQAGYTTKGTKYAKLVEDMSDSNSTISTSLINAKTVYLVDTKTNIAVANYTSAKRTMFSHQRTNGKNPWASTVDFTDFTTPGTYRLYTPIGYSPEFTISDNPYKNVNDELVKGLYYQRCGIDITESQGAGVFAHEQCHITAKPTSDSQITADKNVRVYDTFDSSLKKFVSNKNNDGSVKFYLGSDFAGGLHDAGDYGRYTTPAAQTASDLMFSYEMFPETFTLDEIQDNPNENIPDVLDEARWETKFLLNMQADYGGVYFKICTDQFASTRSSAPENDLSYNKAGLRVSHVTFASTAASVGTFAEAYIVFKDIDPEFANECLEAAKKGYDWYMSEISNGTVETDYRKLAAQSYDYVDDKTPINGMDTSVGSVGGGSYGGSEFLNDSWFMQCALYRATGDQKYHTAIKANTKNAGTGMSAYNATGFGTLSYVLAKLDGVQVDNTLYDSCVGLFSSVADSNLTNTMRDPFNCANYQGKYSWGSNAQITEKLKSNAIMYFLSKENTPDAVRLNLGFICGNNPNCISFITGLGEKFSNNIHHVQSWILKSKNGGLSAPGLMAGGFAENSTPFYYNDDAGDAVCNEICVYWNSDAIFSFAAVVQEDMNALK